MERIQTAKNAAIVQPTPMTPSSETVRISRRQAIELASGGIGTGGREALVGEVAAAEGDSVAVAGESAAG